MFGSPCLDTALFLKHTEPLFRFHFFIFCFVLFILLLQKLAALKWWLECDDVSGVLASVWKPSLRFYFSLFFMFLRKCFTLKN